jgi:hypothetical protein
MTLYIDTKPTLEWVEDNDRYYCKQGEYHISLVKNGLWFLESNQHRNVLSYYETPDEAKAAAQADYDRHTAERFRAVELPLYTFDGGYDEYTNGFNKCLELIYEAIAKAKEQP